ncbi:cytochrome P450 2C8-like [Lacerta agilis]|uniref:cytochrome P450 2C8-like n=1 Tax=Lacerta agilis TaxID=80427 RepID=UPI00141A4392|nr:cytochrome P450 2C8-like [Lacerta agilis]
MEVAGEAGVLILLLLLSFLIISSLKMYQKQSQLPPGPTPLPFVGNLLQIDFRHLSKSYQKLTKQYGQIFTIWIGPKPMVVLCGYEVVKDALVNYAEEFGGQSSQPILETVTKNLGISTRNKKKWKELRRFTLSTMRNFGMGKKSMAERIQEEVHCLVEVIATTKGQAFDPTKMVSAAMSNVICSVLFGRRFDYQDQDLLEFQSTMENFVVFSATLSGLMFNSIPNVMKYLPGKHKKIHSDCEKLCAFIRKTIKSHMQILDPQNPSDYVDCFLTRIGKNLNSAGDSYTIEDLVMTIFILFLAGSLSTVHFLLYSLLMMMRFPHIQAKIQQEIDEVIGANLSPGMKDRSRLPYTNAVIHEILRYEPNRENFFPRTVTQQTKFRGYIIPQNTTVFPMIISVLFDPLHWESPNKFNPGHFLNESGEFWKRDAFLPFSLGKNVCPGESLAQMELFLFFTNLLQKFTFQLTGDHEKTDLSSKWSTFVNKKERFPQIKAVKR